MPDKEQRDFESRCAAECVIGARKTLWTLGAKDLGVGGMSQAQRLAPR